MAAGAACVLRRQPGRRRVGDVPALRQPVPGSARGLRDCLLAGRTPRRLDGAVTRVVCRGRSSTVCSKGDDGTT